MSIMYTTPREVGAQTQDPEQDADFDVPPE